MSGPIDYAVAALTLPGQEESGDLSIVKHLPGGVLIAVVDGLGHGHEAAVAAREAVRIIGLHVGEAVEEIVNRCHQVLLGTRGVVMSVASLDASNGRLVWLGVGNVEAVIVREPLNAPLNRHWLLMRGGVVGCELPTLRRSVAELYPGDLLIFATDGIRSGFAEKLAAGTGQFVISPQEIVDSILAEYARGTDDALVLAARYRGLHNEETA